jgi:hypothetical protein
MRKFFVLAAAALVVGLSAGTASAGPLYYLDVLASTSQNGTYSDSLTVQANTTYYYQVDLVAGAVGTTNTQGSTTRTLESAQGAAALSFNVNDTSTSPIPVTFAGSTLVNGFENGVSQSVGTPIGTGTGISAVTPSQNPGSFVLGQVFTGTFTTGSEPNTPGLTSDVSLSWGPNSGTVEINGTTRIIVSTTIEAGSDPIVGFNSLTLTSAPAVVSAVPEPASLVMMGLGFVGVAGLMAVRRRRMA